MNNHSHIIINYMNVFFFSSLRLLRFLTVHNVFSNEHPRNGKECQVCKSYMSNVQNYLSFLSYTVQ